MHATPIILIYPSSHLSFWLTISLFQKSVSVFFCGNMFIGSNLRITCINDIIGYLSYPCDLLNPIWLFLGSTVVLKTALFILFPKLLFHLVRIPFRLCPFICLWNFFLLVCLGYFRSILCFISLIILIFISIKWRIWLFASLQSS